LPFLDTNPTHLYNQAQMVRQYLTTRQVASVLGVSINTVYRWLKSERLPEPMRDPDNNYRLWTVEDLTRIRQNAPQEAS